MKIKLSARGWLMIQRASNLTQQLCPYVYEDRFCGDWCPKFREPKNGRLKICDNVIIEYSELIDERLKNENQDR